MASEATLGPRVGDGLGLYLASTKQFFDRRFAAYATIWCAISAFRSHLLHEIGAEVKLCFWVCPHTTPRYYAMTEVMTPKAQPNFKLQKDSIVSVCVVLAACNL